MTTFVLGGAQTDFARNWAKEDAGLREMLAEVSYAACANARVDPGEIQVGHVGNLAGELFTGQAQLGGVLVDAVAELDGIPTTRHEAACASGSTALLAAVADLAAGHYDLALVVGVEQMRNTDGATAAGHLGSAAWVGHEAIGAKYPWPALFAEVAEVYEQRYGLDHAELGAFADLAFRNAARNPLAQSRNWTWPPGSFGVDDALNPVVEGPLRKTDCGRITDGAAAVLLASPSFAADWARRTGTDLSTVAALRGFGHRTASISLAGKLARATADERHLFPQLRGAATDAYRRAGISGPEQLDVVELHDCFTITGIVAIEHLGAAAPGKGGALVSSGGTERGGSLPVNPGGGLIGLGHPVGATGVRMVHDAAAQVTGTAGETQVQNARRAMTLNVGGSFTTVVCTVLTRGGE